MGVIYFILKNLKVLNKVSEHHSIKREAVGTHNNNNSLNHLHSDMSNYFTVYFPKRKPWNRDKQTKNPFDYGYGLKLSNTDPNHAEVVADFLGCNTNDIVDDRGYSINYRSPFPTRYGRAKRSKYWRHGKARRFNVYRSGASAVHDGRRLRVPPTLLTQTETKMSHTVDDIREMFVALSKEWISGLTATQFLKFMNKDTHSHKGLKLILERRLCQALKASELAESLAHDSVSYRSVPFLYDISNLVDLFVRKVKLDFYRDADRYSEITKVQDAIMEGSADLDGRTENVEAIPAPMHPPVMAEVPSEHPQPGGPGHASISVRRREFFDRLLSRVAMESLHTNSCKSWCDKQRAGRFDYKSPDPKSITEIEYTPAVEVYRNRPQLKLHERSTPVLCAEKILENDEFYNRHVCKDEMYRNLRCIFIKNGRFGHCRRPVVDSPPSYKETDTEITFKRRVYEKCVEMSYRYTKATGRMTENGTPIGRFKVVTTGNKTAGNCARSMKKAHRLIVVFLMYTEFKAHNNL